MPPVAYRRCLLSGREDAILGLAIEGLTDIQIGRRLGISPSTVSTYWVRIRGKLGQFSRTEIAARALKEKARFEMAELVAEIESLRSELAEYRRREAASGGESGSEIDRLIWDAVPEAIAVFRREGTILRANPAFARLFGYGACGEALQGIAIGSLLVPGDDGKSGEEELFARYLQNPRPSRIGWGRPLTGRRRDGSEFRVVLTLGARPAAGGPVVTCLARDHAVESEILRRSCALL